MPKSDNHGPPRRILIVDDSVTIRALIEQIVVQEKRMEVVGMAITGEDAISKIRSLRPDVVLLDIVLPGIDGFSVLQYAQSHASISVIVVSSSGKTDSDICKRAMADGASACFDKGRIVAESSKLVAAIRTIKKSR